MSRTIGLVVVTAAALVLGVGQASARSNPTAVENLAGHWQGFFDSSVTGEIGTFTLDMTAAHNRQLDGMLMSPTLPTPLPFHVTVGASDVFTAVSPGGNFVVHGMQDAFIWFEEGAYRLRQGGMTDLGMLHFFKSFSDLPAVQLPSMLDGTFVRDDDERGIIAVLVQGQQGNDFNGVAMFGGIPFPFLGSIGAADAHGMAPVRALSVSPAGVMLVTGDWNGAAREPHLDGRVMVTFADGSVHTADFELVPAV
jgi:prepilin-type processing-associated H-X9-DG protein